MRTGILSLSGSVLARARSSLIGLGEVTGSVIADHFLQGVFRIYFDMRYTPALFADAVRIPYLG